MGEYVRFISYLYEYKNREKGKNTGYIKFNAYGDEVKVMILVADLSRRSPARLQMYLIVEDNVEKTIRQVYVKDIDVRGANQQFSTKTSKEDMWGSGCSLSDCVGVVLYEKENAYYGTLWKDNIMDLGKFKISDRKLAFAKGDEINQKVALTVAPEESRSIVKDEKKSDVKDEKESVLEDEKESIANGRMESNAGDESFAYKKVTSIERLLEESPKLPCFENSRIYQCVRIEPDDIGRMPMPNWKYGMNSFLIHGYYQYHYLMLGKIRFQDNNEHFVLGVPGVYAAQERYLANMFGFDQFVPVKRVEKKSGNFGYWIVVLEKGIS